MGMFGSISSVCCSPTSTEQVILSTTGDPSPSLHIILTAWWWFQCIFFLVMNFLLHLSLIKLQGNTRSYRDFIWEVPCNFSESFRPEKGLGFSQKLFRASSFLQSIWNSKFLCAQEDEFHWVTPNSWNKDKSTPAGQQKYNELQLHSSRMSLQVAYRFMLVSKLFGTNYWK